MQAYLQKLTIMLLSFCITCITHIGYADASVVAMRQGQLQDTQREDKDKAVDASALPSEKKVEVAQAPLSLVKVAHKDALELLHEVFIPKTIEVPSYTAFLQNVGIKFHYSDMILGLRKGYHWAGGGDFHFCSKVQVSFEVGRQYDHEVGGQHDYIQDKGLATHQQAGVYVIRHKVRGSYGLGSICYLMVPNPSTNAYAGISYGKSWFDLMAIPGTTAKSGSFIAGWLKFILGSETRLIANLYAGLQGGVMHLLHCSSGDLNSNYTIPGYGKIANRKLNFEVILYLKWNITFLEKKLAV